MRTWMLFVPLFGACQTTPPAADGDSDADVDADADSDSDSSIPPATASFATAFVAGAGPAAGLGTPFVARGDSLEQRDAPTEGDGRTAAEGAIGGDSVVTDPLCVGYSWAGLSVTVTFTGCILETTGQSLDGSVTLAVTLSPAAFSMTLGSLTIDGESFTGTVALVWVEGRLGPLLDVDMTYESGGASTHLVLDDISVTTTAASASISGTGSLDTGTAYSLTMTGLTWQTGDCLPTSGSVMTPDLGPFPVTVSFLSTTPADGIANVQVGAFTPVATELFAPCP